jgi:hypothetical protein
MFSNLSMGRERKAKATYIHLAGGNPPPATPHAKRFQSWPAWAFKGWFLLLAHTISSIALSLTIALAINGYNAVDTSTPRYFDSKLHLRVSDVTTLVSVGLVVNRFFSASWIAVAIWRGIYILQNTTPRLSDQRLLFMQKYRLPPWARHPFQHPQGTSNWIIFSTLLCILPQPFIAPLISGAVNWNPVSVPGSTTISVNSTNPTSSAVYYEQFPGYGSIAIAVRQEVLARAQGFASMAWSDTSTIFGNGTSSTGNGCRHVVINNGLTKNSTLLDSIVPCIRIQKIDWARSASDISSSVANDVFSFASSQLSVVNVSLDLHSNPGQAFLFNPDLLWNSTVTSLPASTIVSGPQTLAVSIAYEGSTNNCTNMPANIFGDVNNFSQDLYLWFYACYAFANVTITAGVTRSPMSKFLSPNVIEDQTPLDQVIFEPNLWAQAALWLLPDLMSQLALANASRMPTWDNLDGYAENIIRQAYLAAWDSLHQTFDDITIANSTNSTAIPAVSRIQASISNIRVFAWLGISLLVLVGGVLLDVLPFAVPELDEEVKKEIMKEGQTHEIELVNAFMGAGLT